MNQTAFRNFLNNETIHKPEDIDEVIKQVRPFFRFADNNQSIKYFDVPCSFDIETSSFFRSTGKPEEEKVAIMYEWTFGIFGLVIVGRTWDEYEYMIERIRVLLDLNDNKRLICGVHNLGHEFQYIRQRFSWKKVFSIKPRTPIYALDSGGIEYRCTLLLSGYRLEKLADELKTYKIKKLVGSLDYDKIRHSATPLTKKELAYCVNDVKIVMAYIAEKIEQDENIANIPLTKTGYVRNYCRQTCFYEVDKPRKQSFKRSRYMEVMKGLRLTVDEYKQLKRAFQGGFTHANPFYSRKVMEDVTSYDFTSSYPAVMLSEKFPMSSSEKIEITSSEELERNLKLYFCVFDIDFFGLKPLFLSDNYISESRCWSKSTKNIDVNNGRIVSAEHISTTLTDIDFTIIRRLYTWDKIRIYNFRRYKKGYLPTDFVKAILKLYRDKTVLKGVDGKEVEYMNTKEMCNSAYGMTVMDVVRDEIVYDNFRGWLTSEDLPPVDYEKQITKYNNNRGRFLFYPWGVAVTAYARRNLWTGIIEFGEDYLYSDTDSIKVKNPEKHRTYIEEYNRRITEQLKTAMKYHGIDENEVEPKTIKGVKKPLGVWDFDGHYSRFKTLGAKRYLVEYSDDKRNEEKKRGTINITVSGLNKQKCVPYMLKKAKNDIDKVFKAFDDELYIPANYTGKLTHTYIDDERSGVVIDYRGTPGEYCEKSSVHLYKSDYSLSISEEYVNYLLGIEDIEY